MLPEKIPYEFAIAVSCETGSSRIAQSANHAYKVRTDWLVHFYTPCESEGYKVASPTDQLRLTWNRIWTSLGSEQETIKYIRTRASEVIIK